MAMEVSADGLAVRSVDPQTEPAHALTVAVPAASAKLSPRFVTSFVIEATALLDELHVADASV